MSILIMACTVNAQIADEVAKSKERIANLQKLCDDYNSSGNPTIDEYGEAVKSAAILAINNSTKLEDLWKRQNSNEKPLPTEWIDFAKIVKDEAESIKVANEKFKAASEEAKKMMDNATNEKNKLKAVKQMKSAKAAASVVAFGGEANTILIEESAAQAKIVAEIINSLK